MRDPGRRFSFALAAILILVLAAVAGQGCFWDSDDDEPSPTPSNTIDPTYPRVAFIDDSGNLAVVSADGTGETALTNEGDVTELAVSPTGSEIALVTAAGVRVVKADGEPVFIVTDASKPHWSPTGDRIAVERNAGIEVRDAAGTSGPVIAGAQNASWAPGGGSMAVMKMTGETGVPVIVDLASGVETPLSGDIEPHAPTFPFAWHPQGLVLGYRDRLYEPSTGNQQGLPGVPVSWSPDGRTLMVAYTAPSDTGGTTVRLLDGSQNLKEVIGLDVPPSSQGIPGWEFVQIWTDWTPNGRFLVFMDPTPGREQVRVYDAHEYRQYRYSDTKGELPDVSPDNSVVVYMQDGKVWLMATDGSFLKNELAEGTRPAWLPLVSP